MPALARWALPTIAAMLILPLPAAPASAPSIDAPARVTREDILAGRATPAQVHDYLRSSLQMLGAIVPEVEGEEVTVGESDGPEGLGGYAYPVLAVDLDGDGDDAVLLEQYTGNRRHLLAVEGDSVSWRYDLPKKLHQDGLLVGDLSPSSGTEVLFIGHRHIDGDETEFVLGLLGRYGLMWSGKYGTDYPAFQGLVQADGDPQSEIALRRYGDGGLEILVVDGWMGDVRPAIGGSFGGTGLYGADEAFVTDGAPGTASEAVFVTQLPAGLGYQAERRQLDDGEVTASEIVPQGEAFWLGQGPDYTGDGRRDGVIDIWEEDGETHGVFDAATLRVAWTQTTPRPPDDDSGYTYDLPYTAGDVDGDGGEDLCMETISRDYGPDGLGGSWGAGVSCRSGRTGLLLWRIDRSGELSSDTYGYGHFDVEADLDADLVPDPVLESAEYRCSEEDGCETLSRETVAFSGRDTHIIWADPDLSELGYWSPTDQELDGVAGDDILAEPAEEEFDDLRPRFTVINGLDLATSWDGAFESDGNPGYIGSAIGADLDGDGVNELVSTAYTYEFVAGDPDCWEYCEYEEYLYLAAFAVGGERSWQFEL